MNDEASSAANESWLFSRLKASARSFYLTLRILPASVRTPIGLAYLLARIADTLADHTLWSEETRLGYLHDFRQSLLDSEKVLEIAEADLSLLPTIDRQIVSDAPTARQMLQILSESDRQQVANVVSTLISGMEQDLKVFQSSDGVIALKTIDELERYTYLVAGCVGEFWTDICLTHIPALAHWQRETQVENGIRFGKALQLTNILRDIPKDHELGRCYVPQDLMQQFSTTSSALVDKLEEKEIQLIEELIKRCLGYYQNAIEYTLAIPDNQRRLRIACILPIVIGIKTVDLLYKDMIANKRLNAVKITRREVYKILLKALLCAGSERRLKEFFNKTMSSIPSHLHK